jgi:hypothetical protein
MGRQGSIVFETAVASHTLSLATRDIHLLDGRHFFRDGWTYRKLFGLDFIRGLKSPPREVPLVTHRRMLLLPQIQELLRELETQRDLVSFDYTYSFDGEGKSRYGGAQSGIRVEGGYGFIDTRPSGYCDFTISSVGPNGRGRVFAIFDMRVVREYETLDRGKLRVHRRKAEVGWFSKLPELIDFLEEQSEEEVVVLHKVNDA